MLLIFFQNMAVRRFTTEMVLAMLQQEPNEDEEAVFSVSESEISDDDDPDYLPQDQAGGGLSGNPAFLHEDSSHEESSDESSEEETQIQSNRLSKNGSYWNENPPNHGRTRSHNIFEELPRTSTWIYSCFTKRCLGCVHE